jgi:multidrug efflux pump subunit AcrA (membrane-fusion protein)
MGEALVSAARTPSVDAPRHCDEAAQRAARRTLRAQITRLEAELADALVASFAMRGRGEGAQAPPTRRAGTPRLLDLGELERVRDELAARLQEVRAANARRAADQAARRAELERMRLAPGRYRFTRISSEELGEPGCGVWYVRPRLGLIGMLAGWWQLTLSSGCPLAPL